MRSRRTAIPLLLALVFVTAPARNASAGPQKDAVCQGSCGGGCGPCGGGSSSYSSGGGMAWGHMTSRNLASAQSECGDKPLCVVFQSLIGVAAGAVTDVPYYAVKGVGYGLYYGGMGLGKGLYYTGRAIGRGIAYPFNRPPKPVVPPATWEQYKHDVLRYQKRLTKANKANKENERWCKSRVPLAVSAGRSEWEARCNPGDAISRAALPPDIKSPPPAPVEAPVAPVVAVTPPGPEAASATTAGTSAVPAATPETPLAKPEEPVAPQPIAAATAAGDPVAAPSQPTPDSIAPAQTGSAQPVAAPAPAPQQVVQTGIAPSVAGLNAPAAPSPMPASGSLRQAIPSGTPAGILTPSEYSFEGRGGASVRYDQIWGKETAADEFIAKWNIVGPLKSMQETIRTTSLEKGTEYVNTNVWDAAVKIVLDLAKRIRGGKGIVERVNATRKGRNVVASYTDELVSNTMTNVENAALDPESAESDDALEKERRRNDALGRESKRLWMGQVRDPIQLKQLTLEQTKDKLWPTSPTLAPIRSVTVCHFADPNGLGCSTSKLIIAPP